MPWSVRIGTEYGVSVLRNGRQAAEFILAPRRSGGRGYRPDRLKYFRSGGCCPFFVGIR
jgi:hypothetical protein